jgi:molecular chaperone DnaJ
LKNVHDHNVGDLLVRILVEVPTHLNSAQKAKLQEFAGMCGDEVNPIRQSFFERAKNFFR